MTHTHAWRSFKRMQDAAAAIGSLIYAIAAVEAWRVLNLAPDVKRELILWAPGAFLVLAGFGPIVTPPLRRRMVGYVWNSFTVGVGQSLGSVSIGAGLLSLAAGFIAWRLIAAMRGGGMPAGLFCGYAAGVGVLWAQVAIIRRIEREPGARPLIEEDGVA